MNFEKYVKIRKPLDVVSVNGVIALCIPNIEYDDSFLKNHCRGKPGFQYARNPPIWRLLSCCQMCPKGFFFLFPLKKYCWLNPKICSKKIVKLWGYWIKASKMYFFFLFLSCLIQYWDIFIRQPHDTYASRRAPLAGLRICS